MQLDPEDHDPDGPREYLLRSAGRPLPWVELRIADPVTGEELGSGEIGEVWLRAPNVMAGTTIGPRRLRQRSRRTVGCVPVMVASSTTTGYLFLTDRIKDMIVSGGENVYPVGGGGGVVTASRCRGGCGHRRARRAMGRAGDGAWSSRVRGPRRTSSSWSNSPDHDSLATSFPVRSSSSTNCRERRLERCSSGSCVTERTQRTISLYTHPG